jgi:hypothetical protein
MPECRRQRYLDVISPDDAQQSRAMALVLILALAWCRQAALPWQFNAQKTGRKAGFIFQSN